jgi:putative addiction module CopG family antidote
MTIQITGELQSLIQQEFATGQYHSQDDVLTKAVRLLRDRREKLEQLRKDIEPALARLDQGLGEPLDMEAIKAEARRTFEASEHG